MGFNSGFKGLISCFPVMFLRYCLSDFEWFQLPLLLPVSLLLSLLTYAEFLLRGPYILKYYQIFFLITFLSPGIATSVNMHVPCLLSRVMMSGLLLGIVLSVCTCWFHNMVTLPFMVRFDRFWYMFIPLFVV